MPGMIPLAGSPSQAFDIGLSPSANIGGSNTPGLPSGITSGGSIGGRNNPFLPTPSPGQTMPPMTTTNPGAINFPANTGGAGAPGATPPLDITSLLGLTGGGGTLPNGLPSGSIGGANFAGVGKGLSQAGYKSGVANLLAQFLFSGAGYNPQVAQALIAQMQPSISRGEADIMEQFGSMGLGSSSAAAIGLGDYLSQVQLNEGQILSSLYEQSVQNYLSVLEGAKTPQKGSSGILGLLGQLAGAGATAYAGAPTGAP